MAGSSLSKTPIRRGELAKQRVSGIIKFKASEKPNRETLERGKKRNRKKEKRIRQGQENPH